MPVGTRVRKTRRTKSASSAFTISLRSLASYPTGTLPPIHMPFSLEAAILSRILSPVTSLSNWAKESKTFRVTRPMEVVVFRTPHESLAQNGLHASSLLRLRWRNQRDGGLGGEQEESECLLQVQTDRGIVVVEVPDGDVLADVEVEITATGGQYESAGNGRGPDDLIFDQALDVLQHRVSVVAGLSATGGAVGAEKDRGGAVDPDETQLAQALGTRIRVLKNIGGERHDRVAGSLADTLNASGGIALEYGGVLDKGDLSRSLLRGLPVRVIRASINVINSVAIQFERNAQFDERLYLALPRDDAFRRGRDCPQVAGADGREVCASRPLYIDHAPSCEVTLEGARCFLFDLSPCQIGNGSKLAMEIIHVVCLL